MSDRKTLRGFSEATLYTVIRARLQRAHHVNQLASAPGFNELVTDAIGQFAWASSRLQGFNTW